MSGKQIFIQPLVRLGIGTSLIASALMICTVEKVQASFTCGQDRLTYEVRPLDERSGAGVRCVRLRPGKKVSLYWYGEGIWEQRRYRHIGGYIDDSGGFAFDIFGNGESFNNSFPHLSMSLSHSPPNTPQTIRVTGAWNEEWTLVQNNIVQGYTSTLGPVRNCGSNFQTYYVRGGNGIRCIEREHALWYGEGIWRGRRYGHIGIDDMTSVGESFDICEPSRFSVCNSAPKLTIQPHLEIGPPFPLVPITVTGNWNETWDP